VQPVRGKCVSRASAFLATLGQAAVSRLDRTVAGPGEAAKVVERVREWREVFAAQGDSVHSDRHGNAGSMRRFSLKNTAGTPVHCSLRSKCTSFSEDEHSSNSFEQSSEIK